MHKEGTISSNVVSFSKTKTPNVSNNLRPIGRNARAISWKVRNMPLQTTTTTKCTFFSRLVLRLKLVSPITMCRHCSVCRKRHACDHVPSRFATSGFRRRVKRRRRHISVSMNSGEPNNGAMRIFRQCPPSSACF